MRYLVGDNRQVALGVRDAGQHISVFDLAIVQVGLVALVNLSAFNLSGASGAGSSAAAVGQVNSGFLCCVQDVGVLCE